MLTRRRFLGYGAAGLAAAAAGCRPAHLDLTGAGEHPVAPSAPSLKTKFEAAQHKARLLGYPINMNEPPEAFFAWRQQLQTAGIGRFAYNNVGNPYRHSPILYNTHDFERELIERFGRLFRFPPGDLWGFLSHSGTDSNMHGMYMGRTLLKGRSGSLPLCYFTKEAHYSIQILRDLLGLDTEFVGTLADGAMDPDDLEQRLAANRNRPALVVATVGTTFKGAIDPVDRIRTILQRHPVAYLHVDAALFGGYLPHTGHAAHVLYRAGGPQTPPRYDSIAVSCHKFFGFPAPAGLFMATRHHFDEFNTYYSSIHNPEYIGHVPGTITCSRDAVKPAEFHFFSSPEAMARQAEDAEAVLANTNYLMERMQTGLPQIRPTRASAASNTIYFRKPDDRLVRKYSLATMRLADGLEYAHVVVMPHAGQAILDQFLADLERSANA